jgi:hypothetical protein
MFSRRTHVDSLQRQYLRLIVVGLRSSNRNWSMSGVCDCCGADISLSVMALILANRDVRVMPAC